MNSFFIKCDEATLISDKEQYKEAGFWERLKLSFHLLMCKDCKVYSEQNAIVSEIIKIKALDFKKDFKKLSKEEKEVMKNTLIENL